MAHFVRLITSSYIDQFSKFYRCQNQDKTCNNTITKLVLELVRRDILCCVFMTRWTPIHTLAKYLELTIVEYDLVHIICLSCSRYKR